MCGKLLYNNGNYFLTISMKNCYFCSKSKLEIHKTNFKSNQFRWKRLVHPSKLLENCKQTSCIFRNWLKLDIHLPPREASKNIWSTTLNFQAVCLHVISLGILIICCCMTHAVWVRQYEFYYGLMPKLLYFLVLSSFKDLEISPGLNFPLLKYKPTLAH